MLYEVLKTAKMGAGEAPDLYTALLAKNLRRDGEVKTLSGIPPLTFSSNGQPLLDYLISGNTVQSGTPTPDNPIMPQGTGERTGNLFDGVLYEGFYNDNGQLVIDPSHAYHTNLIKADTQTAYTVSNLWVSSPYFAVYEWDTNKQWLRRTYRQVPTGNKITFTLSNDCAYFSLQINSNYDYKRLMLNTGSTALPYEPYGYKIPISSGGTTTPVYLGEVESTRRIKKLVLTGEENITSLTNNIFRFNDINDYLKIANVIIALCSHYVAVGNVIGTASITQDNTVTFLASSSSNKFMYIKTSAYSTAEDFASFLAAQYAAGTPVTVWYVLATAETAVVNEPLQKIGDYADTLSMEQAEIEIPTTRGTNTLDVLTDVKPSEVYIKYKS